MNWMDILLITIISAAFIGCVVWLIKNRKKKKGCPGCCSCCTSDCAYSKSADKPEKK